MAQTVIGMFEEQREAQEALNQLEGIGIDRSNVDIARGSGGQYNDSGDSDNASGDGDNAITRFFKNLFGDDDDADRYSTVGNSGQYTVVTVHAQSNDQALRAANILDECGAVDVDERANTMYRSNSSGDSSEGTTISRVQEEMQVGKRVVQGGGVRVRSRIVERPIEESLRLREEHVWVERNPVNRPLTENDGTAFQEQDFELTERAEIPVMNKQARVVEEINIGKDVNERTETVRDTVRGTEVDIDKIDEGRDRESNRITEND